MPPFVAAPDVPAVANQVAEVLAAVANARRVAVPVEALAESLGMDPEATWQALGRAERAPGRSPGGPTTPTAPAWP